MNCGPAVRIEPSLDDQIRCVEREIAMRERVYPKLIKGGRMKQATADQEYLTMKAVLRTLVILEEDRKRHA